MTPKKSLAPAVTTAALTALFVLSVGFCLFFWGLPPHDANGPVTPSDIWRDGWTDGFITSRSTCGWVMHCRLSHFRKLILSPPITWRLVLLALASVIGAIISFLSMHERTPLRETLTTIRGNRIFYDADARQSLRNELLRKSRPNKDSLWLLPYVQLTPEAEGDNIGILGAQNSGKTGVLRGLAEQIIARGERIILHDAKGDLTASLPTDDFILIAAQDLRDWVWAIGRDILTPPDAMEVAAKFIPSGTTGETVWTDSARLLFAGLIETLQHAHGTDWGWEQLYDAVFKTPLQLRAALEKIDSPAALIIEIDDTGKINRTTQSTLLTLWVAVLTTVRPLVNVARTVPRNRRFSINEWLSPRSKLPKTIILQHAANYPLLSAAQNGLLVEMVAGSILAPSTPIRSQPWLNLIFDELSVLKKLERFPELLSVGREKGVRAICATQDWSQIVKLYGEQDANTLEARFKIKIVCQVGAGDTRKRVLHFEEKRTVREWLDGGKGQPRTSRDTEIPVIQAHQLSSELGVYKRGKQVDVRVAVFGLGPVAVVDIPFTAWTVQRPAHVPLPAPQKRPAGVKNPSIPVRQTT